MSKKNSYLSNLVMPFQFEGLPIRGRICRASQSIRDIVQQHDYPENISKFLSEAVILTVLMADSIKLKHRLSLQIQGKGDLKLIATDYYVSPKLSGNSKIRGYAKFNSTKSDYTGEIKHLMGEGYFATILDQGDGSLPYKGLAELNGVNLVHSAEEFFIKSEQLKTRFWTYINRELDQDGKICFNGIGLMLQYLPDEKKMSKNVLSDNILDKENWKKIVLSLDQNGSEFIHDRKSDFSELLLKTFLNQEIRVFKEKIFEFGCGCSPDKVVQTMSIYSRKDLDAMTNPLGKVTADCQFCGAHYEFNPSELGQDN
ncbi:MAG: hypothetical protein CML39_04020 [Rhodobacteraceae bacterium]|nr:MAG: hypothetical protein CML39_04020 [Paracoccaceae bacterium]